MHPIAFHLGTKPIHWYGVMMALAFLAGLWTAGKRARRVGIAADKIHDIGPWLIIGSILGARLVYVLTYWNEQFAGGSLLEIFMVWHGGLVYYGGLVGATAAAVLYCRKRKLPVWTMADILAPSISLGYIFGRIGCLLNGCCYGRACSLPWAIRFPEGHETHPPGLPATPVHPTEIYDALLNLILYLFLAWLYRRKKFDGQVFAAYLLCYAVTRSIVESFRGDYTPIHIHGGLTPAHLISIFTFAAGLTLMWWRGRRHVELSSSTDEHR